MKNTKVKKKKKLINTIAGWAPCCVLPRKKEKEKKNSKTKSNQLFSVFFFLPNLHWTPLILSSALKSAPICVGSNLNHEHVSQTISFFDFVRTVVVWASVCGDATTWSKNSQKEHLLVSSHLLGPPPVQTLLNPEISHDQSKVVYQCLLIPMFYYILKVVPVNAIVSQ